MTFAFHISREARERYGIDGRAVHADRQRDPARLRGGPAPRAADERRREGRAGDPARVVQAGQLNAMGLLDEILHAVGRDVPRARSIRAAMAIAARGRRVARRRGRALEQTLETFVDALPDRRGDAATASPPTDYLAGATDGVPNREIALEELLMLWLANANPAFEPLRASCSTTTRSSSAAPTAT